MKAYRSRSRKPLTALFAAAIFSISPVLLQAGPASADDKLEADQLVQKAGLTFQGFMCDEKMDGFRSLIRDAKGVMIIPSLSEGALAVGPSGGDGVLFTRDSLDGDWRGPTFYTIGGASFGLQVGGRPSEVILLAMTERGVASFLGNGFKFGGDVGGVAGPVGTGYSAAMENLGSDIVTFSRARGLYGGVSLEGAVVSVRHGLNRAYFGGNPSPTDILITHADRNPGSGMLAGAIARAANARLTEVSKSQCAGLAREQGAGSLALPVIAR